MTTHGAGSRASALRMCLVLGACVAAAVAACSDGSGQAPGGSYGGADANASGASGSGSSELAITSVPLRPLTPFELSNALQDLIGDPAHEILALHPNTVHGPAETLAGGDSTWSDTRADRLEAATFSVAQRVVASGALAACASGPAEDTACVAAFYDDFLPRALRRPASAEITARITGVFAALQPITDRSTAIARSLQAALLSPEFLYLTAFGDASRPLDDGLELTPYELAERMSFFVWASIPDAELTAAAARDELREPAQLQAQMERMLTDPRAGRGLGRYVADWTGAINLSNKLKNDPAWTASLAYDALQETQLFSADWYRGSAPTFSGLFDSDSTFVTPALAGLYGVPAAGEDFHKVSGTKAAHRTGLLTQAGFLASHASISAPSPVMRGEWVLKRVLCQSIGAPPNDAQDKSPTRDPSAQNRKWYEDIANVDNCGGCHYRMNPPGYPFESYDSTGRYRSEDQGSPVRTDAVLTEQHLDLQGEYADAEGFARAIGQSQVARRCFTQGMFSYAIGRAPQLEDGPLLDAVATSMGQDAHAATVSLVTSNAFRRASR